MDIERTELSGSVSSVIYRNEENGYTVLRFKTEQDGIVTATGYLPLTAPGEYLLVSGQWRTHPTHGAQFQIETAEQVLPENSDAIYEYLSSGIIRGIGPATARSIVKCFGDKTLDIIENEAVRLAEIKGITEQRALEIGAEFRRQLGLRGLFSFLMSSKIDPKYAIRLYRIYGDKAKDALMENPYILTHECFGAEFFEADELAFRLGFEPDCDKRVQAAVLFELEHNLGNGHTFIPRDKLASVTARLIDVSVDTAEEAIEHLIAEEDIVYEHIAGQKACYLARMYDAEIYVAYRLGNMACDDPGSAAELDKLVDKVQNDIGLQLEGEQRLAVETAACSRLLVLTGGPGTGKTTTVRAIVALYKNMGIDVVLTAPTGRAAKRMSELCGAPAVTVHRLLEAGYGQDPDVVEFKRDEDDPLRADAVILDESSMVDIVLMEALLRAMKPGCRLIMVGDADQLPSVGPGNVFSDVIRSGITRTVVLEHIFRQAEESRIVKNAHLINAGEMPDLSENKGDFFFMPRRNGGRAAETIMELCAHRLPKNMGIDPAQIQVLSPTRLYEAGTVNLNQCIQRAVNPPSEDKNEKNFGDFVFREGDRVMQIRNNYDIIWEKDGESGSGIYNGDIGTVVKIDSEAQVMTVDFDAKLVEYAFDSLAELEPAYAVTVHKAQGSEYRAVIVSLVKCAPALMSRAVLYTAVTRAKDLLIVVGDPDVVSAMVYNNAPQKRYSGLKTRLMG